MREKMRGEHEEALDTLVSINPSLALKLSDMET